MKTFNFNTSLPLRYHWVGKFQAPNENWKHLTRNLMDYELFIITDGILYIGDSDNVYEVKEKEFLIMPPNTVQYGYKASECTFYWLHFSEADCPMPQTHITIQQQSFLPYIERLIILLKQLQDSERRYHNKDYNHYLTTSILYEIYNQLETPQNSDNNIHGKLQLYTDITDFISWHIGDAIRIEDIAYHFGYSSKYLSSFFKKACGINMKTYILNTKMDVAKAMLTDTNDTISQIAYSVGFQNSHNFSSCFKKITGLTPSDYRDSYAKRMFFHQ